MRRSLNLPDFERLDLLEILEVSVEGDVLLSLVELDAPERLADVVLPELRDDIVDRQVHCGQFFAVQQDVDLHLVRAVDADLAHAGNRGKPVCDHIVGVVVEIVLRAVADQEHLRDGGGVGVDLADGRLVGAVRQVLADAVQRFADIGGGHIDIGAHVEFELDAGLIFHRHAGDVLDSVQQKRPRPRSA